MSRRAETQHDLRATIAAHGFSLLGSFEPVPQDQVPQEAKVVVLIGNAGPAMFRRFQAECDPQIDSLDDWTRQTVGELAAKLDALVVYPFDKPALPFLRWARRSGAGHVSPLGLNIHAVYGLWHAYRAALLFSRRIHLPASDAQANPCKSCVDKPCLHACPVSAFNGSAYDVDSCTQHLRSSAGQPCMAGGCLARRACPVGQEYTYHPSQMQFHMRAFLRNMDRS